jgi:outer membrane protein OmpA-like peptidoglycan-associated protein
VPVIVNDVPAQLPAIAAAGNFFGDQTEFLFLDDPDNPLTLRYRFGIGAIHAVDAEQAKATGMPAHPARDRDVLNVVKITYRCAAAPPAASRGAGGNGPATGGGSGDGVGGGGIERALETSGRVDVYSIYFSFNSDTIRDESEPTLKEIADVLRRHADWKLALNGHTDAIGGDQYNLDLSKRRAAAVKTALVSRYGISADRLSTSGFGKAQPKDTNDTLEGRARNRRVELVKGS